MATGGFSPNTLSPFSVRRSLLVAATFHSSPAPQLAAAVLHFGLTSEVSSHKFFPHVVEVYLPCVSSWCLLWTYYFDRRPCLDPTRQETINFYVYRVFVVFSCNSQFVCVISLCKSLFSYYFSFFQGSGHFHCTDCVCQGLVE